MDKKFQLFLEVTKGINEKLNCSPVLFGSLGVSIVTEKQITVNDIDILLPDRYLNIDWPELKKFANSIGFELINEHEHEFRRLDEIIAFAEYSVLSDVGLTINDLTDKQNDGVDFKLPSAEQLIKIYQYSQKDGYRLQKRNDAEKLDVLKNFIKSSGM